MRRELRDAVLELTIDRPERMNAVDMVTMRELTEEILAAGPRRALELTKWALNAVTLDALDRALEREHRGQVELLASTDFAEGAAAMLQKHPPRFP